MSAIKSPYTIHVNKNGIETLRKNGKNVFCPLKGVHGIPSQTQLGQQAISFHEMPCVAHCAHFNDKDDYKKNNCGEVEITCQNSRQITIESVKIES